MGQNNQKKFLKELTDTLLVLSEVIQGSETKCDRKRNLNEDWKEKLTKLLSLLKSQDLKFSPLQQHFMNNLDDNIKGIFNNEYILLMTMEAYFLFKDVE